ncbi:MAG: hypothetical protein ACR2J1_10695 [Methyloceanibacter sp.]|uniref:hypothetical protein n=1 Tax=Methyloceanibacter sp. TaxID=1965321 RepID=UPI003D9AD844
MLESPNWRLDRGKQSPVKMTLGPQAWDTEVAAEANAVSIDVNDKKCASGLRTANTLNVLAAGPRSVCPSIAAGSLERLEACVAKNSRAIETNPFVEPPRKLKPRSPPPAHPLLRR